MPSMSGSFIWDLIRADSADSRLFKHFTRMAPSFYTRYRTGDDGMPPMMSKPWSLTAEVGVMSDKWMLDYCPGYPGNHVLDSGLAPD